MHADERDEEIMQIHNLSNAEADNGHGRPTLHWKSGEAAASSEPASATITSESEGWCTQMSAMRKPCKSTT